MTDARPTGLIARYQGEFDEIKVVFLVLNLGQHDQREAAKATVIYRGVAERARRATRPTKGRDA
jgi:hypothetical protein